MFRMLILQVSHKKSNIASLKTKVEKLDIDKLKILPYNLSNLKSEVD